MTSMEETLKAKLLGAQKQMGTVASGMATTATAIANINAPASFNHAMLAKAHAIRMHKPYLPNKPQKGEFVFRSNFAVDNYHMPDGRIIPVRNHFCVVANENDVNEILDIAKATRAVFPYEGPWAEDEVTETPSTE